MKLELTKEEARGLERILNYCASTYPYKQIWKDNDKFLELKIGFILRLRSKKQGGDDNA